MLTLQSVKPDADLQAEESGHAVFTTTDGLAVTVLVFHAAKDGAAKTAEPSAWARFSAAGPDAVKAEAEALNKRLNGWSFEIGSWKEKSLVPTLDDLKAPEEKKAPAPASAPAAGDAAPVATGANPVAK